MEQIIFGNLRVQILSEDIVRIERAEKGGFCDENTFFIPDRAQYSDTHIGYSQEENVVCFGEYELYLPENGKSLSGVNDILRVFFYNVLPFPLGGIPALGHENARAVDDLSSPLRERL